MHILIIARNSVCDFKNLHLRIFFPFDLHMKHSVTCPIFPSRNSLTGYWNFNPIHQITEELSKFPLPPNYTPNSCSGITLCKPAFDWSFAWLEVTQTVSHNQVKISGTRQSEYRPNCCWYRPPTGSARNQTLTGTIWMRQKLPFRFAAKTVQTPIWTKVPKPHCRTASMPPIMLMHSHWDTHTLLPHTVREFNPVFHSWISFGPDESIELRSCTLAIRESDTRRKQYSVGCMVPLLLLLLLLPLRQCCRRY